MGQDTGDDIISKKSLLVVKEIINFLKEHAREEGLFRRSGRRKFRRRIFNCLNKGEKPQLDLGDDVALECAAALQLFLTRLKKPVIPKHVQELILADNPGVTAGVVARDALGLIRQDISGRHSELLADLLNLIRYLTLSGPPSERTELQGSPLPIALLPVFFALKPIDLMKWKQVAARFNELITEAPKQLRINENRCFESTTISRPNDNNQNEIQQETQSEESTTLAELPVLCPFIRFTDNYNRFNAGEMAHTLATAPLHWPTADRLHPLISHTNRQIRSNV
ncbi:PREDICTED: uncharacterized protein LOC106790427 [Polistes canadensis]|uniref:uncharacterized protein LOC106790427 n=1 Tax=Polistes canadensis TaxID=91411 RepID=UPI000718F29F|nr:PREDICTED: uncharacterized protein LOC106790427 [Polistes canadensis]